MPYLFLVSATLSSFFFSLILVRPERSLANNILSAIFLLASINVGYLLLSFPTYKTLYFPVLTELHFAIPFLYGTLVYFYTRAALFPGFKLEKKHAVHLLIFFLYLAFITIQIHSLLPLEEYLKKITCRLKPIVNAIYLLAAFKLILSQRSESYKSNDLKSRHRWISWLIIGGLGICGISIFGIVLNTVSADLAPMSGDYVIGAIVGVYFFILGHMAFKNSHVFHSPARKPKIVTKIPFESSLDFEKLLRIMEQKKPFLDAHLSLHKLADCSAMSTGKLSKLINQHGRTNFHDFVNGYRVREVQAQMAKEESQHLSLLGIALECGFNSKASFNRTFKKITGLTPSAYRDTLR